MPWRKRIGADLMAAADRLEEQDARIQELEMKARTFLSASQDYWRRDSENHRHKMNDAAVALYVALAAKAQEEKP